MSSELNPLLQMCLTRYEKREKITSLILLAMLCLMQSRSLLTIAVKVHCWFMFIFLPTRTPRMLLCRSDFQLVSSQHVLVHRVTCPEMKDFEFRLPELHEGFLYTIFHPSLRSLHTTIWYTSNSSQFYMVCKLVESAVCSSI